MYKLILKSGVIVFTFFLAGCFHDDDNNDSKGEEPVNTFTLQLLHFADIDGGRDITTNAPRFSALVDHFRTQMPENTLLLSSGDNWIPGPEYAVASDDSMAEVLGNPAAGRAHVAWLNAMGVQASALGNHEFDLGTGALASILSSDDSGWDGAQFPYLSANLDYSVDENLAPLYDSELKSAEELNNKVASYTTFTVNGEVIGVVAATTTTLASITSTGDVAVLPSDNAENAALAAEIQKSVDVLKDAGINKIILLAHMQRIDVEQDLAQLLSGVDIIVAGGSNTLLADSNDRLRDDDSAAGTYPLEYTNADNEPTLVVNTDGDFTYLGRLVVEFDDNGVIQLDRLDTEENGAYATDELGLIDLGLSDADAIAEVSNVSDALTAALQTRVGTVVGNTDVYLNGVRGSVRTEETNLGNLTADANLWVAQQADASTAISLKNGGGIRAPIGACIVPPGAVDPNALECVPPQGVPGINEPGDISLLDLETALRFNNDVVIVTVTGETLVALLENGLSAVEFVSGRFPQIAGMTVTYAPENPAGQRLVNLTVLDDNGALDAGNRVDVLANGVLNTEAAAQEFRLATLGFLAGGGDGYPFPADMVIDNLVEEGSLRTGAFTFAEDGSEQDALAEYLNYLGAPYAEEDTPREEDLRIQIFSVVETTIDQVDFENGQLTYSTVDVASTENWSVENWSGQTGAAINAYGSNEGADDWLVSPVYNLSNYSSVDLSFDAYTQYEGDALQVVVLENYTGDLATATQTVLDVNLPAEDSRSWQNVTTQLNEFIGRDIHVAFHYVSTGTVAGTVALWAIDNIEITGVQGVLPLTATVNVLTDQVLYNTRDIALSSTATGGTAPYTYEWIIDGVTSTDETATANFAEAGDYEVVLNVTDSSNRVFQATRTLTVHSQNITAVPTNEGDLRIASYNVALNRFNEGDLLTEMQTTTSLQAQKVAEVIQLTRPDIVLLNEFDYEETGASIQSFINNYLEISQNGAEPISYDYFYIAPSNTGVPSELDFDNSGSVGGPNDAYGFGFFPGQYGMALLSRFPIEVDDIRTFQTFLWRDMPGALLPTDPVDADGNGDTTSWYNDEELNHYRLSSKSHWDVPVNINGNIIHVLASHPTPPVFDDGDSFNDPNVVDWNGRRNFDEIRFWLDYINSEDYIYDDAGVTGGLAADTQFVVMGDLNASPDEGDGYQGAMDQLLSSELVVDGFTPESLGGIENDPANTFSATHTASWRMRADYVLPSTSIGLDSILNGAVFWPTYEEDRFYLTHSQTGSAEASDHRLVYLDLDLE